MARGGYRPGSGPQKGTKYAPRGTRKQRVLRGKFPKYVTAGAAALNMDPLTYMLKVMNDPREDKNLRARMAVAAAPFCHARKGEGAGKKEEKSDRAKQAGKGKFSPGKPPVLNVVGNK